MAESRQRSFPLFVPPTTSGEKELKVDPAQSSDSSEGLDYQEDSKVQLDPEKLSSVHSSDEIARSSSSDRQKEVVTDGDAIEKQQTNESKRPEQPPTASVNDVTSIPNGGLRAWVTCLGSFFLNLNCWGILNTFGVYQTYYTRGGLPDATPSAISWIGSGQAFCLIVVSSLAGPLYDAGYFRYTTLAGTFLVVFGHMMLSISHEYYQVFLSQAICVGVGAGCLFLPSVAILSTYFSSRLATAIGLAASGSSVGGIIYPIALSRLITAIGFAWATRALGFIALATLIVSNLVMKPRVLPAAKRKIVDWEAFREAPYMLFVLGALLSWAGLYAPFFYLELYSLTYNMASADLSFYTIAILNAGSVFGRIFPNIIADYTGTFNIIVPASVLSGVLCFTLIPVRTIAPLLVVSVLYGFTSGALVSLPPSVYIYLSSHKRGMIGTRMGMGFLLTSAGILLGAPACGWILAASSFTWVWTFAGLLMVLGGICMAGGRVAKTGSRVMVKA